MPAARDETTSPTSSESSDARQLRCSRDFIIDLLMGRFRGAVFLRPQPPVFFQKYCRTNGGRTAVQMGGVLQYKWEAYCRVFPFFEAWKPGKYSDTNGGAYYRTNWRCTAVLFRQVVGVGVSETLPIEGAVFRHGGGALKQPIKQPTQTPTSTLALMGRFPSLMGRFPTLMGRFTDFRPKGPFYLLKIPWKTAH